MSELVGWLDDYARGTGVIVLVYAAALVMSVAWGLTGAAGKLFGPRWVRVLVDIYGTVFRGTPELLVLLIFYFGSAVTLTAIAKVIDPSTRFVDIPPFWAGALAISLVAGAYLTEIFRGAFLGVDKGSIEGARALGLGRMAIFFLIRGPQMWRIALPGFGNQAISLIKDTALISVVGLEEIMFTAEMAISVTQQPFTMYMTVALIYLCLTAIVTHALRRLETRANRYISAA
jgi:His/Glu/Gln/Arg/opine family amino acid ABC transporter permease subunit